MNLIENIAEIPDGQRMLASSRFRRDILVMLDDAIEESGLSLLEIAQRLGINQSQVSELLSGDGNLLAETISDYLFAMGFQVEIKLSARR